jgi:O-antigen ligase
MAESIHTATGRHWNLANIYTFLALSILLSVTVMILAQQTTGFVAVCCGVLFFALSILLLMGDVFHRFVYFFFLIQIVAMYFMSLALMATVISLIFFPLAFDTIRLKGISNIPNVKPLLLMLFSFVVSLLYQAFVNYGELKYFLIFDIFLILGLVIAYELFFLFKLKVLAPDRLIRYIALSGLAYIGFVIALYIVQGNPGLMFRERLGGDTVVNPNFLASYLDLALPCAFFTAFFEKRNIVKKVLFYALSLIFVIAILMTASRGSLPGIVIIAAYAIWRRRSKLLLLGIFVCAVIAVSAVNVTVIERMFRPSMADIMSNLSRVELLRSAFKILQENHYFWGIGMNNFSLMKFDYGFPLWFDSKQGMSSHNFFVEIWLGWGLLGLLGWIALNLSTVVPLARKHKDSGAACAVVFAIAAFSMHGLFDCVLANYSIMLAYFSLMGVGLFLLTQTDIDRKADSLQ